MWTIGTSKNIQWNRISFWMPQRNDADELNECETHIKKCTVTIGLVCHEWHSSGSCITFSIFNRFARASMAAQFNLPMWARTAWSTGSAVIRIITISKLSWIYDTLFVCTDMENASLPQHLGWRLIYPTDVSPNTHLYSARFERGSREIQRSGTRRRELDGMNSGKKKIIIIAKLFN